MARKLIAKYDGKCQHAECEHDGKITAGEKIVFFGHGKSEHAACAEKSATQKSETGKPTTGGTWIDAAGCEQTVPDFHEGVLLPCEKCNATGTYKIAGYVENGVFKGKTGTCFACGGKGAQTADDRRRNYWYYAKFYTVSV